MIKYHKLTNLHNVVKTKEFKSLMEDETVLNEMLFSVTEKIDGSNFQIEIMNGEIHKLFSRNQETDNSFFNFKSIENDIQENIVSLLPSYVNYSIFGELYGKGVQNRCFYGGGRYFRIFDIYDHDEEKWLTACEIKTLWFYHNISKEYFTPTIKIVHGFKEAIFLSP